MKTNQYLTVQALADQLDIAPLTVYRLVKHGKLPAVRIGRSIRFKPAEIDAFLETVRVGPTGLADESMKGGNHEKRKR
jgi:excisionase family DNA binding protein